MTTKHTLK